ncbi:hypothetical protein ACFVAV_26965 [Nocardia sp. NPDC057663]
MLDTIFGGPPSSAEAQDVTGVTKWRFIVSLRLTAAARRGNPVTGVTISA